MGEIYINNSGGKRKIKDVKQGNEIIKNHLINNNIKIYYKKWLRKKDILESLRKSNIIADIWAINEFIYFINNRKEGIQPIELYIENSNRLIRLRGENFLLTEEEEKWQVVNIENDYYCFLDKKVLYQLNENDSFNIKFENGGIELYSSQILADKKKEKFKDDLVVVRISLNELNKYAIDVFSNDKMNNILLVDSVTKKSFSEILT
ncbi:hypothetical protein V6O07_04700 [Arthrospira platensis SPKY2]